MASDESSIFLKEKHAFRAFCSLTLKNYDSTRLSGQLVKEGEWLRPMIRQGPSFKNVESRISTGIRHCPLMTYLKMTNRLFAQAFLRRETNAQDWSRGKSFYAMAG